MSDEKAEPVLLTVGEIIRTFPALYPEHRICQFARGGILTFQVFLSNSWRISVGYGPTHYSETRVNWGIDPETAKSFEIAIFDSNKDWFIAEGMDATSDATTGVFGWKTSDDLFRMIEYLSGKEGPSMLDESGKFSEEQFQYLKSRLNPEGSEGDEH